jgi:hypothetical protein
MGFCTTLRRNTALALIAVIAAGCEAAAPAPFDPATAAADVSLLAQAFDTPLMASLDFAAADVDRETGGAGAPSTLISASRGILLAGGELPATLAGTTFAFDESSGQYVATEGGDAPESGVRFLLYAVDPSGAPLSPLAPIGAVDVIGQGAGRMRLVATSDDGSRLEYGVTASGASDDGAIRIEGALETSTGRRDFDFETHFAVTSPSSGRMTLRHSFELPARHLSLECESALRIVAGVSPEIELDLALRGSGGALDLAGGWLVGGTGSLAANANGEPWAAVEVNGSALTVTSVRPEPLPPDGVVAVERAVEAREQGIALFDRLLRPVESLVAP